MTLKQQSSEKNK